MTSPERQEQLTPVLHEVTTVVNALESLAENDYAEALTAIENMSTARHPVAYGADLEAARKLLRPQLPQAARQHFMLGYEALVSDHEASLTDYVERTNNFLSAHPGILWYDASARTNEERQWLSIARVEKVSSDVQNYISWVRVVNNEEKSVRLEHTPLMCDITRFEPQLQQTLAEKLN